MTGCKAMAASPTPRPKPAKLPPAPPSRWRWALYAGVGVAVFCIIFLKIGGSIPGQLFSLAAWRELDPLANLAISGVFTGLILALVKIFLDPVFQGIAERRPRLLIAEDLALSVVQVSAGVAAEGLLNAASSPGSRDGGEGGFSSGGGGNFGGGGASGKF